jgi:hypothetical protein
VPSVGRKWLWHVVAAVIALMVAAPSATARVSFKTRIGGAIGIIPAHGGQDVASGENIPVVFHGGSVMRQVTVHTIFWAPSGYHFDGSPAAGIPGYEQLIQRFFTDVAADSGTVSNAFSMLRQYGDSAGPGQYAISYNAAADSVDDTAPYPTSDRCASPAGIATCLTDLQLQREIDRMIQARDPSGRGLHDVWFVFLPPDVDTCLGTAQCGTSTFAGYHGLSNLGRGPAVYAVVVDPLIELTPGPGSDPEGNPEAEVAIDTAAHEAVEAITDPEGAGWLDPNGFEVGDKCDVGPQQGTPLGYAGPSNSPFNQMINGHPYLMQGMWSNAATGCQQRSGSTSSALPLPTVSLRQFSPFLRGSIGSSRAGVRVEVLLGRAGALVAFADATTRSDGSWGPAALHSVSGTGLRAVGDDRDEIVIQYGPGGPPAELIETGDGGNPFTQTGWTGWFALDNGFAVGSRSIVLGPCSQTGVLGLSIGGRPTAPPIEQCQTETDLSVVRTGRLRRGAPITMSSEDNRAVSIDSPNGALVKLTVPLGEPGSVSKSGNPQVLFEPTGFPSCTADLRAQSVRCTGLVQGARYALTRRRGRAVRRGRADGTGAVAIAGFPGLPGIHGGDVLTLRNSAGRVLTTLHVAHLRVDLRGAETLLAGGHCEPGLYYGGPLTTIPISLGIDVPGAGGTGTVCPPRGRAAKLSTSDIEQTDDRSGGQTRTAVPAIEGTSPTNNAVLYGPFIALAQTGIAGPHRSVIRTWTRVSVSISRSSGGSPVFTAQNVDTAGGVSIRRLAQGAYRATWTVVDVNGDTRTVQTRFVEEA